MTDAACSGDGLLSSPAVSLLIEFLKNGIRVVLLGRAVSHSVSR